MGELKEQAKSLWQEYRSTSGLMFYGRPKRVGFKRRVQNIAKKLDPNSLEKNNVDTIMYLDQIALWLDFDLELGGEI